MKLYIVSIYDRITEMYNRPYFVPALGMATRNFADEINNAKQDNPLYKHPDHYELFLIGHFEDSTGEVAAESPPRRLSMGCECVVREEDVKSLRLVQ